MTEQLTDLIEGWDGEGVVCRFDRPTGTWIFIALHDSTLGPPTGGTRLRQYSNPAEGLLDAQRLAEGMTSKWAVLDFDKGGGKAVLAVPGPMEGQARLGLLERYGALLRTLDGCFSTGEDLGTTPRDMAVVASQTRFVHGVDASGRRVEDPGPFTARGVVSGLYSALEQVFGSPRVEGKTVLIQGVGDVGEPIARELAQAGARLLLSDVDGPRVEGLAAELGAGLVSPERVYETPCDVYAPCAIGATLNAETIPRLRCSVVAGSANNQLREPADADRLLERRILYAPDYVINGGGALAFGLLSRGETDKGLLMARMDSVGDSLREIFSEASRAGESPVAAARKRVERALQGATCTVG